MKNKFAIVGIFYDGYYDLWEDFFELFNKFWPDCPYPKYIVDNSKDLEFDYDYGFKVIHAGEGAEYSRRVQTALEKIDADYYFLILEDFFVGKSIDRDPFDGIIDFMIKNGIEYYSMPLQEFQDGDKPRKQFESCEAIDKFTTKDEYLISCQPAVWMKSFLEKCIGNENYNAWIFEGIYVKSNDAHKQEFVDKLCMDRSNPLHLYHGALQGKIVPTTYRYFESVGYKFRNEREVLSDEVYGKHLRKIKIKRYTPFWIQKLIKKTLKTNSVIEKYNYEIYGVMKKMEMK